MATPTKNAAGSLGYGHIPLAGSAKDSCPMLTANVTLHRGVPGSHQPPSRGGKDAPSVRDQMLGEECRNARAVDSSSVSASRSTRCCSGSARARRSGSPGVVKHPGAELTSDFGLADALNDLHAPFRRMSTPAPFTRGCGSRIPITIRAMPRSAIDFAQAGVRPWNEHGSRVE